MKFHLLIGFRILLNSRTVDYQRLREPRRTGNDWRLPRPRWRSTGLIPIVKKDFRFKPPREFEAVECEALSQKPIPDIVRNRLEELLPEPLSSVLAREEAQRKTLEAAIQAAIGDQ
jgi:hypothetical protein